MASFHRRGGGSEDAGTARSHGRFRRPPEDSASTLQAAARPTSSATVLAWPTRSAAPFRFAGTSPSASAPGARQILNSAETVSMIRPAWRHGQSSLPLATHVDQESYGSRNHSRLAWWPSEPQQHPQSLPPSLVMTTRQVSGPLLDKAPIEQTRNLVCNWYCSGRGSWSLTIMKDSRGFNASRLAKIKG